MAAHRLPMAADPGPILVTGAGGFVGQALVRALAGAKRIIATDRTGLDCGDLPGETEKVCYHGQCITNFKPSKSHNILLTVQAEAVFSRTLSASVRKSFVTSCSGSAS